MKNNILYIFLFSFLLMPASVLRASVEKADSTGINIKDNTKGILKSALAGIEYRIKAGLSVGGTMPIPIPLEVEKIKSYNPQLNGNIEAEIMKMFDHSWGLSFGLRLDSKGMKTKAKVKNYSMKMVSEDNGEISGMWTGMVEIKVGGSYLTLPVLAVWKPSPRWAIKLGPYGSCLLSGHFNGSAYDGYLRDHTPVGQKIEVSSATYDFSDDLRSLAWGMQLGGEWRAFPHLLVFTDLTWGMNSIFKKDFDVITFDMYPIYALISFGYAF